MADFLFTEGSLTDSNAAHSTYKASSPALRGVPLERAHPSLQRLLSALFPADSGLRFLEAFLRLAQVEQEAPSANMAVEEGANAVIRVRNQRELAQFLGMDYDRVNRYVLLLQKMHLIARHDEANGIALSLALDEPRLAHPDTLDTLANYRPKVGTFARKVKQRWLALLQAQDACTISCTPQFAQTVPPEKAPSMPQGQMVDLEEVRQVALNLCDAATAHRLLELLTSRARQGSTPVTKEVAISKGNSRWCQAEEEYRLAVLKQPAKENGDSPAANGDSPSIREKTIGDSSTHNGDSTHEHVKAKGDSPTQNGDLSFGRATPVGDSSTQNGDSPASGPPEKRRLVSEKMGDSRATSAHANGDSSPEVGSNLSNVNVTFKEIINIINVNVKGVASYLCQVFGEDAQRQGYYHQLYKQHSNPQAWLGALLETLLAQQRSSVRNPGGYFYNRCVALHKALPAETERLITQFGTYTYAQLQEHLRSSGTTSQATSQAASPSQQPATQARATSSEPEVALLIPREKQHPGMPEETLVKIQHHIEENMMSYRLHSIPYRQQDGTYSLLLADYVKHQRWIYSLEEWQETYARLCQSGRLRDIFNIPAA